MELRVGIVACPIPAILIEVIVDMIEDMENEVRKLGLGPRHQLLIKRGLFVSCFALSPRGEEGFLDDTASLH